MGMPSGLKSSGVYLARVSGAEYFSKGLSGQAECRPGILPTRFYRWLTTRTNRPRKRPKGIRGTECSGLEHKR
jgi:hypothetical protein